MIDNSLITLQKVPSGFPFTTTRISNGRVWFLPQHLHRLDMASRHLWGGKQGKQFLSQEFTLQRELKSRYKNGEYRLRLIACPGGAWSSSQRRIAIVASPLGEVGVESFHLGIFKLDQADLTSRGLRCPHLKLREHYLRYQQDLRRFPGVDEIVYFGAEGIISCGKSHLFWKDEAGWKTPRLRGEMIDGIMRACLLRHRPNRTTAITLSDSEQIEEILAAEDIFLTNSLRGIIRVKSLRILLSQNGEQETRCQEVKMTQKQKLQVDCPHCGASFTYQESNFRPFCSERCQQIDLGKWLDEQYSIAGSEVPMEEGGDGEDFGGSSGEG